VVRDVAITLAAFVLVTALAALLGATNLGTAATFGQIAFVAAAGYVLVKRD
jgi:hypothetical protein